ncbi:DNA polymerase III subunit gamma/tau [Desulfurivibrio alkaliphilus]|uniref:DNA polymerase III subunit gamma/tau n=1 Tax=Desulfurivibrio alkaliphilus (strain DSM 19089 / UNIQEM U267 / AHT2) TaxID=589865 RepID=D6Z319_DESAT|nr:DNA polymerase III subunit gamma/tau [Desulfurivibrio alkaliphilus]ADH85944.1 DNA polymerase III, subunits gamma and tau [Desulfurivibrio alkaliphilus AHT 2]
MSYLVLARKWRPRTFAEVVGQRPVVRTLQNALRRERVAHAMLFSGVRGVGKTTLARIMAKALNCLAAEAEQRPCNQCASCLAFNAGQAVDLHEIDGASNRGIQEIRELKENIRFMPVAGKYKIVIIDEVHMLTTEAFNALLKTLEEPPAHVYFMFATTELHKIPVTILSRCQRHELTRVPFAELQDFFRRVAAAEEVEIPDSALEMIVREADGSVRDGLSLLDQVFSFGGRQVADEDVRQMLGLVDRRTFEQLARALLAPDLARCLELFDQCYRAGLDLKRFAGDLLNYFRNLVVCRNTGRAAGLLDLADQELAALEEIAAAHSPETLLYCFNLLLKGVEEMQYASRPKLVLEMTFVRAAQAGGIVPTSEVLGRLEQLLAGLPGDPAPAAGAAVAAAAAGQPRRGEASAAGGERERHFAAEPGVTPGLAEPEPELSRPAPAPSAAPGQQESKPLVGGRERVEKNDEHPANHLAPDAAPGAAHVAADSAAGNVPEPVPSLNRDTPKAAPPPAKEKPEPPVMAADATKADTAAGSAAAKVGADRAEPVAERSSGSGRDLRPDWDGFIAYVRRRKVWMAPVLDMASGAREENGQLLIRYDDLADCKLLEEPENNRLLTEFAQDYFQRELTVRLRIRGGSTVELGGGEMPREERRALANDPLVRTVVEIFNGDVAGVRTGRN